MESLKILDTEIFNNIFIDICIINVWKFHYICKSYNIFILMNRGVRADIKASK